MLACVMLAACGEDEDAHVARCEKLVAESRACVEAFDSVDACVNARIGRLKGAEKPLSSEPYRRWVLEKDCAASLCRVTQRSTWNEERLYELRVCELFLSDSRRKRP